MQTLNIDQLCREGMKFSHLYSAVSLCAITRACLMPGKHAVFWVFNMGLIRYTSAVQRKLPILLLFVFVLTFFVNAQSAVSDEKVPLLKIPAARRDLAAAAERIRSQLADLPSFSETRQIDAYGFHGEHLPALDEMPESPRWSVALSWASTAKLAQVILVPAIDPRQGAIHGYGFPRRFRVSKQFADGTLETVAEWMTEDCPDPGHVPLQINISTPRCASIRIDVYRGAEEGGREFFALAEIFGIVKNDIWRPHEVTAGPGFESRPYWSAEYLGDQKTGLGMPLGLAPTNLNTEVVRDFSVVFEQPPETDALIEFDLGSNRRMGWLTLFPASPPRGSIVPGYGFPRKIELTGVRTEGSQTVDRVFDGWNGGNPGDNAVRIPLYGFEGRYLRLNVSHFSEQNGRKIFALGEAIITMKDEAYPVQATRLEGFPQGADEQVGYLTDGLVGGAPAMHLLDWFELIGRQNRLKLQLNETLAADRALELRWVQARQRGEISLAVTGLLALSAWVIHRRISLQRLRLRIAEERHQTEMEQMKLRFFTHISHELRTPLTVIPAPIERAMKEVGEGKLRTYLGVALRNVHELQQLVEQILDLRRIQDGMMKFQPAELELVGQVDSIIDTMRPLADAKGIDLMFEPAESCLIVQSDPRALKRILGNLIGNAIKFTPSGGRVAVGLSVKNHTMGLSVEDTGPGIAAEDRANIFEQHYRGQSPSAMQAPGSGLGLALVHEVVGLLGGEVRVDSPVVEGRGSRFTVELPLNKGTDDA